MIAQQRLAWHSMGGGKGGSRRSGGPHQIELDEAGELLEAQADSLPVPRQAQQAVVQARAAEGRREAAEEFPTVQ